MSAFAVSRAGPRVLEALPNGPAYCRSRAVCRTLGALPFRGRHINADRPSSYRGITVRASSTQRPEDSQEDAGASPSDEIPGPSPRKSVSRFNPFSVILQFLSVKSLSVTAVFGIGCRSVWNLFADSVEGAHLKDLLITWVKSNAIFFVVILSLAGYVSLAATQATNKIDESKKMIDQKIDQSAFRTNGKIDQLTSQTNEKIDQSNRIINEKTSQTNEKIAQTNEKIDQSNRTINEKTSQTNEKIDRSNKTFNEKFDLLLMSRADQIAHFRGLRCQLRFICRGFNFEPVSLPLVDCTSTTGDLHAAVAESCPDDLRRSIQAGHYEVFASSKNAPPIPPCRCENSASRCTCRRLDPADTTQGYVVLVVDPDTASGNAQNSKPNA